MMEWDPDWADTVMYLDIDTVVSYWRRETVEDPSSNGWMLCQEVARGGRIGWVHPGTVECPLGRIEVRGDGYRIPRPNCLERSKWICNCHDMEGDGSVPMQSHDHVGSCPGILRRIATSDGLPDLLSEIIRNLHRHEQVVMACRHGKHRSGSVATLVDRLTLAEITGWEKRCRHYDGQCQPATREYCGSLLRWMCRQAASPSSR